MTNLLEKLENIKIKNTERLTEEDRQFCERLQSLYANVLGHYRKMYFALQALTGREKDFYSSVSDINVHGEHKSMIFSHTFFEIKKSGFAETIMGTHAIFIHQINQYFAEKYKVTLADKQFPDYAGLDKPERPDVPWHFSRHRTPEEILGQQRVLDGYEKSLESYYDAVINAELRYDSVVDDIFLSLGGFDFKEKADREIKDAAREAVRNRWDGEPYYTVANNKITFSILFSHKGLYDCYEVDLSTDSYRAILGALTYFDTDCQQADIYASWKERFVAYRKREEDGIYQTHEAHGAKVKKFRYFKNGKFEVAFDSHADGLAFAREFLGYPA